MNSAQKRRRNFLKGSVACAGATLLPSRTGRANGFQSENDRPRMAAIGTGSRWYIRATGIPRNYGSAPQMKAFADYVAVSDVDSERLERAAAITKDWTGKAPRAVSDYRAILEDPSIDVVHISTPDHWHAKIAIEAMLAGKDVYCEKPMTLTIEEGQLMSRVCKETQRVVQIGTQQRSGKQFIQAIALLRAGRIGELKKATCSIGGAPTSPSLPEVAPPKHLDWDAWQGPVEEAPYHFKAGDYGETKSWSRCHYEFRWWYEYSGGKLTDWGAHHVDIATWGLGKTDTGPTSITPVMVKHPVEFKDGKPVDRTHYNTATEFLIQADFADGMQIEIKHDGRNGILFQGTEGQIFVNRGSINGKAVEELKDNPLPENALTEVYQQRQLTNHFANFFTALNDRKDPISDVHSHHRALSTCHLAGIAARLNQKIQWDPAAEKVIGNELAQSMVARPKRQGFEIET